jgi:hypothetical protein
MELARELFKTWGYRRIDEVSSFLSLHRLPGFMLLPIADCMGEGWAARRARTNGKNRSLAKVRPHSPSIRYRVS